MARRQSRVMTEETDAELDLTPMLDVVFILLIFFIVTSVFVKEPGVEVVRPETELLESEKPTILVAVTSQGEIWVNRQVYEMNQMRNVLEQLLEENPRAEAMIQGDQDAPIGLVLDVQELFGDLGVDVMISTQEG
ncbi:MULTISPECIES: ExbD/TolR family protein [Marinicauda]|jgi:biopolymer transport protein ExbD|uniref:Biopolymer transporter ExbD n=1 Tax=Marinicauda pacifica TaxID=1133559 RepID=A0A4S2HCY4_9PROT|nr:MULTISPECIES: biopolymer transporter ExbD [Marinicauda]TGY93910.1 biopolymer transporter ExbD [Marinicauda pacifica]